MSCWRVSWWTAQYDRCCPSLAQPSDRSGADTRAFFLSRNRRAVGDRPLEDADHLADSNCIVPLAARRMIARTRPRVDYSGLGSLERFMAKRTQSRTIELPLSRNRMANFNIGS